MQTFKHYLKTRQIIAGNSIAALINGFCALLLSLVVKDVRTQGALAQIM